MQSEKQQAEPTPSLSFKSDQYLPLMDKLSLDDKQSSQKSTEKNFAGRTKQIEKGQALKRKYKKGTTRNKQANKKQITRLEKKISELQGQIDRMTRKMECCINCKNFSQDPTTDNMTDSNRVFGGDYQRDDERDNNRIAARKSLDSHGSLEFENINFLAPYMQNRAMDERSWIYLGTMMIAMGSCSLDFDGGINIFKVLKESVDTLRRQVQKSEPNISMDFYLSTESMEDNNGMMPADDIGFDPFINKYQSCSGFALEGIKIQSVEQFELIYDNKVKFNLKYEALIAAMEHVRENCWVSMEN